MTKKPKAFELTTHRGLRGMWAPWPCPPDTRVPKSELRAALLESTLGHCFYCWAELEEIEIEHMKPKSRGGPDLPFNFVPSCSKCNRQKHNLNTAEFQFIKGLRCGNLSFSFMLCPEKEPRDWLCCHSKNFEQKLLRHNFPL